MTNLTYNERVLKIAKEIMTMRPGTHPKAALREAKSIAKTRDTYKVSVDQKESLKQTRREAIPDHIKATIKRQKAAEAERKKAGRKLPRAKVVSGGGVSPR